ncbi:hypothetical protein [Hyphomicrobium sp. LHD-15]|uniref:hypothetical protein n=1 Tax=Hyphomicrobium sp. LHD-15 TaxID=3072142 RepID=UPI0028109303|nr:hypothetical protein [Hyphomicrobium sp. LHD-15]MDQ8700677.1 hypothetical protein [Hyphomicrobium sp. LHD-15]
MTTAAKDQTPLTGNAEAAAYPDAGLGETARGRQTFVLGIFPEQTQADRAIEGLVSSAARNCDVLVVSQTAQSRRPPSAASDRISRCTSEVFLKSGRDMPGASKTPRPFRALWKSIHAESAVDLRITPLGTQRLFQHVVNRLAGGATLVIARTENAEQRMATSRALLDANCEVLLTHEMTAQLN